MKKEKKYIEYILKQAEALLAIDSPSGFTEKVTDYLCEEYKRLGYKPVKTKKGGVLVEIGGKGNAVLTMAHVDTLGGMVAEIKINGRLRLTKVGGLNANNIETENCRIYTLDGKVYEGTVQLTDASIHVNGDYQKSERTFDSVEVLLDEKVSSKEDVKALGIENGSFVCMDPRTRITESGYIKSRFLDDKLSTAILLGFAKYVKDEDLKLSRKVYQHITVFEEVGHGACASAPEDVEELLSVDMGCVGEGLECTDRQVSICVKDGHGPYHYDVEYVVGEAGGDLPLVVRDGLYSGYEAAVITDNYVYLLLGNQKYKSEIPKSDVISDKSEIYKLSWEGKLLCRYILDRYVYAFSMDSQEKYFYCTVDENRQLDPKFVRYEL